MEEVWRTPHRKITIGVSLAQSLEREREMGTPFICIYNLHDRKLYCFYLSIVAPNLGHERTRSFPGTWYPHPHAKFMTDLKIECKVHDYLCYALNVDIIRETMNFHSHHNLYQNLLDKILEIRTLLFSDSMIVSVYVKNDLK